MKHQTIVLMLLMFVFTAYLALGQGMKAKPGTSIRVETGTVLNVNNGDLTLESDATGDASLIDYGSVAYSGGGEAKVERYLAESQWHIISSPTTDAVSGMFIDDYLSYHTEANDEWTDIVATDYSLAVMQGYLLWSVAPGPTTEVFSGTTNTGTLNNVFTQDGNGWNMLGNPYPSTLDWDAVSIPAELNGAIWLWDPTIGTSGDYVYYINGGGAANTTSQYIPSGQGFFVKAVGGAGTLTVENADRVHGGQAFYKDYGDESLLVLKVTGNDATTQTAVRFNENATQNVDRLFDVYKIISDSPEVPNLFTKADNEAMAINTLPAIEGNEQVSMWFRAGIPGDYTIEATQLESFDDNVPVYLEDLETGVVQDLRQHPEYVFNYTPGADYEFNLWFTEAIGMDEPATNSDIMIYASGKELFVNFSQSYTDANFKAQISVFDLNGKMLMQKETSQVQNTYGMPFSSSFYIVKVTTGKETVHQKVFIR